MNILDLLAPTVPNPEEELIRRGPNDLHAEISGANTLSTGPVLPEMTHSSMPSDIYDIAMNALLNMQTTNCRRPVPQWHQAQPDRSVIDNPSGRKSARRDGTLPSHNEEAIAAYQCGYCGARKVSESTGGDGRVRIRCLCGGKYRDGKARMHAKWIPCDSTLGGYNSCSKRFRSASPPAPTPLWRICQVAAGDG